MKTTDIFSVDRSAKRLNESLGKTFGKKLNLESFDLPKLEDARNRLRTQLSQTRNQSGFNENLESDAYTKAQWMLDAINAEIANRESTVEPEMEEGFDPDEYEKEIEYEFAGDDGEPGYGHIQYTVKVDKEQNKVMVDPASLKATCNGDGNNKLNDEWCTQMVQPGGSEHEEALQAAQEEAEDEWNSRDADVPMESIQGEEMTKVTEGEVQQASAIVTAKTMVDTIGRWIQDLSDMENETLLQLGDSIRDEMGAEQAKAFVSTSAPAIQQALENLKQTRETLATNVRTLTGEEAPADMLGAEPEAEVDAVEPDAMNTEPEAEVEPADEFATAEPATGGAETAGREKRESIERDGDLLKILAG